ncbi:class I SAM-dependent methyltransferase [Robertmurraya korlensis]|uniref:class I SAM-dependent methyltransferase n=1 Tax=Robertmurraya korlensis TaxID=519977 RepID=UPI00203F47E3|nr:class I SAM-dependent methyltransferase [Robertmurraya korlensis]MCM3599881.1 class I SAM-dependent methyltransferase [Robertmurraya korlensis]
MFVTTAGRTNPDMIEEAKTIALELECPYQERRKKSVQTLQSLYKGDCIVVGKERLELFLMNSDEPFFFHPNSSMFRIKRLLKYEHDPFIDATGLVKGMSLLDCTLGLASDSIVASFVVGASGKVVGTEENKYLAYLVSRGLKSWQSGLAGMDEAMRAISVQHSSALSYIKKIPSNEFDCVYIDPMFEETILESDGIRALAELAVYSEVREEFISEAKRVARRRLVLKDHFRSKRFEQFGFSVMKRPSAKFHFGIITK